jgi:hypothetical protein
VELSGLTLRPARHRRSALGTALAMLLALVVLATLAPTSAQAWYPPGSTDPVSAPPGSPSFVSSQTVPPHGWRLDAAAVHAIAARNPIVIDNLRGHRYVAYEYTRDYPVWQVSWFTPPGGRTAQREVIQAYVDDRTGQVTQVWTGYQVAWTMARGYAGAFGRKINRWYVWIPLCLAFLLPFLPWRRRPTLWHLDLLVLLSFSVSLDLFNQADIGLSVPLVYPGLLYLLIRLTLLAFGRGRPREPLRLVIPPAWLAILLVFLIGFRIGLNVTNSNVIDVGYAGVIGSDKILHGAKLYGGWPADNPAGDTYGPVDYYAYVPATAIFGWSGAWDNLPAAHAAAIAFDLLTVLALFFLGRRIRGPNLGIVLAYLWVAFPFTTYALCSNSNDSLVALFVVLCLLAVSSPPARGVAVAFAGLTKFAPLVLAPLMLRGTGEADWRLLRRPPRGPARPGAPVLFAVAFLIAIAAAMAQVLLSGDWHAFWRDTVVYQVNRPAPFSIWGLWGGAQASAPSTLAPEQRIVEGLTVLFGLTVMVFPRGRRDLLQVAALAGALIIAVQLCLAYWFYLYIPWFFAPAIVALAASHPGLGEPPAPPATEATNSSIVNPGRPATARAPA